MTHTVSATDLFSLPAAIFTSNLRSDNIIRNPRSLPIIPGTEHPNSHWGPKKSKCRHHCCCHQSGKFFQMHLANSSYSHDQENIQISVQNTLLPPNNSIGSGGRVEKRICSWNHVKVVVDNFLSNEMFA